MAETAIQCGCTEICFTDHMRKNSAWWPDYFSECRRVAQSYAPGLKVSCGAEMKVCDFHGTLDIPPDLDKRILRVAALHRLPDGSGGFVRKEELNARGQFAIDCWFHALAGLSENLSISRIAHPFSLLPYLEISLNHAFWNRVIAVMDKGAYLIEYNLKYDNSFVPPEFWQHFAGRVVVGSDSHSAEAMRSACRQQKDMSEQWIFIG